MFDTVAIKRLTFHRIYSKSKTNPKPFSEDTEALCELDVEGVDILVKRISTCFSKKSKFYELSLENDTNDSVFEYQKFLKSANPQDFIRYSNLISEHCAESHISSNIPDGLLLVVDCLIDKFHSVVIIKAEKSDAFSAEASNLNLVKNIFLSSDKTLYKVGFFIRYDDSNVDPKSYKYYVYDDAFVPSKSDLATYFYKVFLGLSTDQNAKLLTNNLYKALNQLIQTNVKLHDRPGLLDKVASVFKDPDNLTLFVSDFRNIFPESLHTHFDSEIASNFPPHAILKDLSIVSGIKSKKISLTKNATLVLKDWPQGVITGSTRNKEDLEVLTSLLVTGGGNHNYAFIPSDMPSVESIGNQEDKN